MSRIARNGRQGGTSALTAATDSSGVATFIIPASKVAVYGGSMAMPVGTTASGRYTVQITSEPAMWAVNTAGQTVTVAVSQSLTTGVLIGGAISGLGAAGAGVTVRLFVHGV